MIKSPWTYGHNQANRYFCLTQLIYKVFLYFLLSFLGYAELGDIIGQYSAESLKLFMCLLFMCRMHSFNLLWPSEALWRHKSDSTMVQFPDSKVHGTNMGPIWGRQDRGGPHDGPMNFAIWAIACYLTALTHYPNCLQLIIFKVLWSEGNFTGVVQYICLWYELEHSRFNTAASPKGQWANHHYYDYPPLLYDISWLPFQDFLLF